MTRLLRPNRISLATSLSQIFYFFFFHMCRPKRNTNAIDPKKTITVTATNEPSTSASTDPITESTRRDSSKNSYSYSSTSTTSTTLSSARRSLPPNPTIYSFSDISSATSNFRSNRISFNSWRCSLPLASDVVVVHRKIRRRIQAPQLHRLLFQICKCHHVSLACLLGAAISADNVYIVYDHAARANLADCLRSPKNPNFTVLSTWISRMQVAADAALVHATLHWPRSASCPQQNQEQKHHRNGALLQRRGLLFRSGLACRRNIGRDRSYQARYYDEDGQIGQPDDAGGTDGRICPAGELDGPSRFAEIGHFHGVEMLDLISGRSQST